MLNGSGVAGAAQGAADALEGEGFTILDIDNAPEGTYARRVIYSLLGEGKKPASLKKMHELYPGVTFKTGTPPVAVPADTDFVVIVGK